jgi:hypothetical protein
LKTQDEGYVRVMKASEEKVRFPLEKEAYKAHLMIPFPNIK